MKHALILGSGMVGSVMAWDMAKEPGWDVTLVDARAEVLTAAAEKVKRLTGKVIQTRVADLRNRTAVRDLAQPFDLVLGALSSTIAYQAMLGVIDAGRPYCDIAFMPEDIAEAHEVDQLAKSNGVTCVVDCGVAPGMSHMLAQACVDHLDTCENLAIYVGGLPRVRHWPFDYKAAFSPADVIEEYTRPARLIRDHKLIHAVAMSEPELLNLPGAGTLEAFNTDGLRSLVTTLKGRATNMVEKTLRYPGHIELMRAFAATGLFSQEPVRVGDISVSPRDLLAKLMFPLWSYKPREEDLTVMRVTASGARAGKPASITWDLLDFYDTTTQSTSMGRTTALPCTIVARAIADGRFNVPGLHPPEHVARAKGMLDHVLTELAARGVRYTCLDAP